MRVLGFFVAITAALCGVSAHAQDSAWHVGKVSGDVMLVARSSAPVTLVHDAVLNPGDGIRTGRNGRLLLVRGEETILISPNSAISIPQTQKEGLSTTIAQQAGSILLTVEKRNVRNFEVETPYLAAVVKGTQFSVTVDSAGARVDVREGSVEVADMKTGQFALVLPGQAARVGTQGTQGLILSGAGQLNAIQRGEPRKSNVAPLNGARADLKGSQIASTKAGDNARVAPSNGHAMRIAAPIGAVKLDIATVTRGMARGNSHGSSSGDRSDKNTKTFWNSNKSTSGSSMAVSNGNSAGNGGSNGGGSSNAGGSGSNNGNAYAYAGSNSGKGKGKGKQ